MTLIKLPDARFVEDSKGRLWLPISEILNRGIYNAKNAELIQVGDESYYEVVGYSLMRRAYWVEKIEIEGAADNLEAEFDAIQKGR